VKRQIAQPNPPRPIKQMFSPDQLPLSELPLLLNKQITLDVPVYTVWGACEDVRVLERFRSGEYKVDNLHIIDEVNSRLLDIGGVKLRLLGLGGAVVIHKLFDNGEGKTYIAGGQGTMWTTLLQIGALIDTANRVYDPSETRIFLTHASPARDGILNQLSVTLKADFSISAGLHFRYGSSYNEFSVNPSLDHYRGKLAASKASFNDVWETVKVDVEQAIESNTNHKALLKSALEIVEKMPSTANGSNPFGGPVGNSASGQVDESAFKNMWNFNLADAAFGYLVLEVEGGRIGTEMRAQGFNFAHRGKPNMGGATQQTSGAPVTAVSASTGPPSGPAQHRSPAFPAPTQPFPQQQKPAQQQQPTRPNQSAQQGPPGGAKTATPPTTASPAPPVTQAKALTPQPSASAVPTTSSFQDKPATPATNGTSGEKAGEGEVAKVKLGNPPADRKPPTALYVSFVDTEQAVKDCFVEEDREKIKSVVRMGSKYSNWKVQFENHDIAQAALTRAQAEVQKNRSAGGKAAKIVWFEDRVTSYHPRESHSQGGAGTWQGSNRGAASSANSPSTRGGYQSGGASDSEGGRGRGAFRGRGRGRGEDRGGRGGRGGRGLFQNKPTDGASDSKSGDSKPTDAPKPAAPATES
jgi:hypothetical protein